MKHLRFLLAVIAVSLMATNVHAQASSGSWTGTTFPWITTKDTLTNAASKTYTQAVVGQRNSVTLQVNLIKISGTVAGTVKYYGSADNGNNYVLLQTDNLTDASGSFRYVITGNPYTHVRVVTATTGTSSASVQSSLLVR